MPSLLDLPVELHVKIWSYLDNPEPLSKTSRALRAISRNPHVRTEHFLGKGPRHAVFYALRRSRVFDQELFRRFGLTGGSARGQYVIPDVLDLWAFCADPVAMMAVLQEGYRQYPERPIQMDDKTFTSWANSPSRTEASQDIKDLSELYNYAILPMTPVSFTQWTVHPRTRYGVDGHAAGVKAIEKDPSMAVLLENAGLKLQLHEKQNIVVKLFGRAGQLGTEKLLTALKSLLINDAIGYQVKEDLATKVILSLKHMDASPHELDKYGTPFATSALSGWKTLQALDSLALLQFSLRERLESLVDTIALEPSTSGWRSLQKQLSEDCPYLRHRFAKYEWTHAFVEREELRFSEETSGIGIHWAKAFDGLDVLTEAHRAVSGISIRPEDIIQLLMRLEMVDDTLPLAYANFYLDIQDWNDFAIKLARALLCHPYKGKMLVAINSWFESTGLSEWSKVLAAEVSRSASLTEESMPRAHWNVKYRNDWYWSSSRDNWHCQPDRESWKHSLGISSDFMRRDFLETLLFRPELVPSVLDPGTVCKEIEEGCKVKKVTTNLQSLLEQEKGAAIAAKSRRSLESALEGCMHNTEAIVDICGPKSTAAQLAFKHAVLFSTTSSGSDVVLKLIEKGCDVTPWHVLAFQKQGTALPAWFMDAIRFKGMSDPEDLWSTIVKRGRSSRLSKSDIGSVANLSKIGTHQERKFMIGFDEDGFLVPEIVKDSSTPSTGQQVPQDPTHEHDDAEKSVADGGETTLSLASLADVGDADSSNMSLSGYALRAKGGIRLSSRIAAAAAAAAAASEGDTLGDADEEIIAVADFLPYRATRRDVVGQIRAGERWIELLELLLTIEVKTRKMQYRAFRRLATGSLNASGQGSTSSFEKTTPERIEKLRCSIDLLRQCLECETRRTRASEYAPILSQELLSESLDLQTEFQQQDEKMYKTVLSEIASEHSDSRSFTGRVSKRKRAQFSGYYSRPRNTYPAGDLSEDDEDFQPDAAEVDIETSDEEMVEDDHACAPPSRTRRKTAASSK
ncbi:unnamed protein product [Sympodiomycopsis kandeliae]